MKVCKLFLIVIVVFFIIGCASETEKAVPEVETDAEMFDDAAIRHTLNEFIRRTKEGDKTVLYENEFDYYKLEVTLSDYYELDRVKLYKYDTLKSIEVDSIKLMENSAKAYVRITYESILGGETERSYSVMVYRSGDHWIKPYQSNFTAEKEFRDLNAPLDEME